MYVMVLNVDNEMMKQVILSENPFWVWANLWLKEPTKRFYFYSIIDDKPNRLS